MGSEIDKVLNNLKKVAYTLELLGSGRAELDKRVIKNMRNLVVNSGKQLVCLRKKEF